MGFIKEKYKETVDRIRSDRKENKEASDKSRKEARKVYFEVKEKERIRLAGVKAKLEADATEKAMNEKIKSKPQFQTPTLNSISNSLDQGLSLKPSGFSQSLNSKEPERRKDNEKSIFEESNCW